MYFPFFILHGWRKRSAIQPQTIYSEFPFKKRDTGTQRRIPPRRQCLATVLSILPEKPKNQLVNLQKNLFSRRLFFCYLSLALKKPVGYNNL